ncbi:hypothetical protein BS78_10G052800 [Paspalum vaginatum]|nr:hypothetical protein BS78_10G052800 [Paspalum vaginatum]
MKKKDLRQLTRVDEGSDEKQAEEEPVVLLNDLPSPISLQTMHLALGGARIHLPTTMKFASLIDVSLERVEIVDPGADRLLAHLVSSASCPRLQKLRMTEIMFPGEMEGAMRLEANEILELWVDNIQVSTLELRTPRLRSFHIDKCGYKELRVSAPRLEEFSFFRKSWTPTTLEVNDEMSWVRSLKISLWSHKYDCVSVGHNDETLTLDDGGDDDDSDDDGYDIKLFKRNMNINMLLLKQCSSVTCLDVTLESRHIIKSRLPHVRGITSLTVNVSPRTIVQHDYGASVASLLMQFGHLKSLSLRLHFLGKKLRSAKTECNHQDYWTSHEISMTHLLELEFTGLTGTDCELWFMKVVLASAKRLCKVAISFHTKCWQYQDKMDAFERMLLEEGMWTSHRDTFMLNSCKTHRM